MKALVLAGGPGTRLREEVSDVPKPMADVAGRPFLEWQLELLSDHDVTDVTLSIGYKGEVIRDHFGDGSSFGVSVEYVEEDECLETGGAVRNAKSALADEDVFLIVNGDTYLDADLDGLIDFHRERETVATLALAQVEMIKKGGFVELGADDRIEQFIEEKRQGGLVNAGYRVFDAELFEYMPAKRTFPFEWVMADLIADGTVAGFTTEGYFRDIGTPAGYREINERFSERRCT